MKVLITGANGQVGRELVLLAEQRGVDYVAFDRNGLDITDAKQVTAAMEQHVPTVLINAAAYTAVDRAEDEPDMAARINADAVAILAKACAKAAIPMIHLSTDYVFSGEDHHPYDELSPVAPTGVYGKTKLAGEQQLMMHCPRHIIVRTSWVFGRYGHNFVKTMLRLGEEKGVVSVVNDQHGKPTAAAAIAATLIHIATRLAEGETPWGIYHYAGDQAVTWHAFAQAIFDLAGLPVTVNAVTSDAYVTKAQRPAYSVLETHKIEQTFDLVASS